MEIAAQALGEENLRLKEEIARLQESKDDTEQNDVHSQVQAIEAHQETSEQAQQDSHSRTILAALMSGAGMPGVEEYRADGQADNEEEASWMEGVESFIKESESGRLGELAAAAVGAGEGQEAPSQGQLIVEEKQDTMPNFLTPIAAAINTDMERLLRDEIKTVQAQLDSRASSSDMQNTDPALLRQQTKEVQDGIARLEAQVKVLREVVLRMTESRDEEEESLEDMVNEVRALGMDGGERERDRVRVVLQSVKGYIGGVLNNLDPEVNLRLSSGG